MERYEVEQLMWDIARQAAQDAALAVGNGLPMRQQLDGYWGATGGSGGGTAFPQRTCDPFFWRWNSTTGKVKIGNIIFYKTDGTWATAADAELTMADGTNYVYAVYAHPTGVISVATTTTEADAYTADADRTAGNQKLMLYKFTKTGTALKCTLDRIHHGAIGTNFW